MKLLRFTKKWLNVDGEILSTEALRIRSRNWDEKTWEEFLCSTVDVKSTESLVYLEREALETKYYRDTYIDSLSKRSNPKYNHLAQLACHAIASILSDLEHKVILDFYWNSQSLNQIAKSLNIDISEVITIRDRAYKKVRNHILADICFADIG